MARHVLPDQYYTFTPSTRTIVLSRAVKRESLLLITNVTTNTVIYNFSDPNLKATGYTNTSGAVATSGAPSDAITTIVLNYNTTSMSSTDKLQIIVDEYESKFSASDALTDPVGKLRTSTGQALIDTDFEYGLQPTKWEQLSLVNMKPCAYIKLHWPNYGRSTGASQVAQSTISSIVASNGSRLITVTVNTTASTLGWNTGQMVFIQDSMWGPANGLFVIENSTGSTFTYKAREVWNTGSTPATDLNDPNIPTQIFDAPFYTQAGFGGATITASVSGQAVTVTTSNPHGLEVGNEVALLNDQSGGATTSTYGNHQVATVLTPFQFVYYTDAATGTAGTWGANSIYVRPPGTSLHRAFDGGINFSTNTGWHNQQMIRQTRRYFRYQSGKGIQISTGTSLRPQLYVDLITSSATTVTVRTRYQHGLQPNVTVTVGGAVETAYNGNFVVTNVLDAYRFQYTAGSTPSSTTASGPVYVTIRSWYGGTNRTGMFDHQNGFFFEFDGQNMNVVSRKSTYQVGGFAVVTNNSHTVTGYSQTDAFGGTQLTQFSKQLNPNDFIVIRGATYRVLHIIDDQTMHITPQYRGPNGTKVVISKTTETRVAQSAWNIDRCDGTGPSGFILDPSKMQMYYIDYSWYGAGWVRFGFRQADGNIVYVHKIVNNNQNTEAYMRSGNLPARYETNTYAASTTLSATLNTGDTTLNVASTTGFPSTGTLMIRSMTSTTAGQTEYVNYTGTTATQFTGLTRGQAGSTGLTVTATQGSNTVLAASTTGIQVGQTVWTNTLGDIPQGTYVVSFVANTSITLSRAWMSASGSKTLVAAPMGQTAQTFTYSATRPISVSLHAPLVASVIQHWGTSVIMDGRYDDDKSFVFTRGSTTSFSVAANANNAIMSLRIAPSVSNGNPSSTFGSRDLVNRMQMVLRAVDVFTNQPMLVTAVLNAELSAANTWVSQGGSSLAQYFIYSAATTYTNGEVIGGYYVAPSAASSLVATSIDLNLVRDMGNSILGGGATTYAQYLGTGGATGMYPDGPDTVTFFANNLNGSTAALTYMRASWTEAQA